MRIPLVHAPSPLRRTARPLALAAVLAGCGAQDLANTWELDRLRVLAIAAEPAELVPGETAALRSLVYVPTDAAFGTGLWIGCLPSGATDFGCGGDADALTALSALDPENATPAELAAAFAAAQEAGLLGIDPFFPPTFTAPTDALDGLSEQEQAEGLSAVINLTVVEAERANGEDPDVELVYKRVPVSRATTPNHNPELTGWRVDGAPWPADAGPMPVKAGATLRLQPVLAEASIETYTYLTTEGVQEDRVEQPFFLWYTEAGDFDQALSLYPEEAVEWTAPDTLGVEGIIAVVVHDRRGGMGWRSIPFVVE